MTCISSESRLVCFRLHLKFLTQKEVAYKKLSLSIRSHIRINQGKNEWKHVLSWSWHAPFDQSCIYYHQTLSIIPVHVPLQLSNWSFSFSTSVFIFVFAVLSPGHVWLSVPAGSVLSVGVVWERDHPEPGPPGGGGRRRREIHGAVGDNVGLQHLHTHHL